MSREDASDAPAGRTYRTGRFAAYEDRGLRDSEMAPTRRLALAVLNVALADVRQTHSAQRAHQARAFFTRTTDCEVLIWACQVTDECRDRLAREAKSGTLPPKLPRQRQKRPGVL